MDTRVRSRIEPVGGTDLLERSICSIIRRRRPGGISMQKDAG